MKTVGEKSPAGVREIVASLRDVTVTYDGYQSRALNHMSVDFPRGGVVGVLGGKGAGKSTLLRILAGRLRPTEGTAKVFGRTPTRGSVKARIGYLPGKMDASRPKGFFNRLFGAKKEGSVTARGAARLTQAVLGNRDLLILDDPFEGLQAAEVSEAKALIREMAGRGKTIILSSDSLMDVKELCGRFVILHEGRPQGAGTLEELLATPVVIRFLPAVLPGEMVERILGVLRKEVLNSASATPAFAPCLSPSLPTCDGKVRDRQDACPTGSPQSGLARATADDSIDHQKLEELTKPKQPE